MAETELSRDELITPGHDVRPALNKIETILFKWHDGADGFVAKHLSAEAVALFAQAAEVETTAMAESLYRCRLRGRRLIDSGFASLNERERYDNVIATLNGPLFMQQERYIALLSALGDEDIRNLQISVFSRVRSSPTRIGGYINSVRVEHNGADEKRRGKFVEYFEGLYQNVEPVPLRWQVKRTENPNGTFQQSESFVKA